MGSVALAEELLLLAYDDESGRATGSHIGLDLGMAGAVRMEPTLGLTGADVRAAHQQLEKISDHAGFTGTVSMEESSIRPSVALVVAVLVKAIQTALGTAKP